MITHKGQPSAIQGWYTMTKDDASKKWCIHDVNGRLVYASTAYAKVVGVFDYLQGLPVRAVQWIEA